MARGLGGWRRDVARGSNGSPVRLWANGKERWNAVSRGIRVRGWDFADFGDVFMGGAVMDNKEVQRQAQQKETARQARETVEVPRDLLESVLSDAFTNVHAVCSEFCATAQGDAQCDDEIRRIKELGKLAGIKVGW